MGQYTCIVGCINLWNLHDLAKIQDYHTSLQKRKEFKHTFVFGFVGIFCLVFLWPMLVMLNYFGVEKFELPPTSSVATIIAANAVITL